MFLRDWKQSKVFDISSDEEDEEDEKFLNELKDVDSVQPEHQAEHQADEPLTVHMKPAYDLSSFMSLPREEEEGDEEESDGSQRAQHGAEQKEGEDSMAIIKLDGTRLGKFFKAVSRNPGMVNKKLAGYPPETSGKIREALNEEMKKLLAPNQHKEAENVIFLYKGRKYTMNQFDNIMDKVRRSVKKKPQLKGSSRSSEADRRIKHMEDSHKDFRRQPSQQDSQARLTSSSSAPASSLEAIGSSSSERPTSSATPQTKHPPLTQIASSSPALKQNKPPLIDPLTSRASSVKPGSKKSTKKKNTGPARR